MTLTRRPRLLAFDIDSTLVTPAGELKQEIIDGLRACHRAGMHVAYLTNRAPRLAAEVTDSVGVPALTSTASGCLSWEYPGWHCIDVRALTAEQVALGLDALRPCSVNCYVYAPEEGVELVHLERRPASCADKFLARYYPKQHRRVSEPTELQSYEVYKLAVVGAPEEITPLREALPAQVTDCLYSYVHQMRLIDTPALELTDPRATKGEALKMFAQRLGIAQQEVVAVGDSENDIPMLSWAGHGVSMPVAGPKVRAAADQQLEGDDPAALAGFLQRLLMD